MKRIPVIKETTLLRKYWRDEWHLRKDGSMWIRVLKTGKIIEIGRVDHGQSTDDNEEPET